MFFPIGDDNPSFRTPYVTYGLVAANSLVFLTVNRLGGLPARVALEYGLVPAHAHWYAFFTSMFLHGDILHLLGNMVFLWIAGDNVEDKLGHLPFLGFYLLSGVFADLAYILFTQVSQGGIPLVGASGAIAGVLGAYMLLFPRARIRLFYWFFFFAGTFRIEARWFLGFWIAENLVNWLAFSSRYVTGVAYAAHVGGFAVGVLAAVLLKGRLRRTAPATKADELTGFAGREGRARGLAGGRIIGAETRPRPPRFVSPRAQTDRDAEGFFGAEEAIADNLKNGRVDAALERYAEYVRMRHAKPLPPWAQIEIAGEFFRRRDYEASLQAYRRYLAVSPGGPDAAEAKFRLGIILSRHRKEYYRAREYLLQATMEHQDPRIVAFAREELQRIERFL